MYKKYMLGLLFGVTTCSLFSDKMRCDTNWQTFAGAGFAWSMDSNICVGADWIPATEGYSAKLGQSPLFYVGITRNVWRDWLNVGFKYTGYCGFTYQKYQSTTVTQFEFPYALRTRFFDLHNSSYLIIARFTPRFDVICNDYVEPVIGLGLGLSHSRIDHFYTVAYAIAETTPAFNIGSTTSIGTPVSSNSLAAEFLLGLQSAWSDTVRFGAFYSFYYGGQFRGPCKIVKNTVDGGGAQATFTSWKGHLKANQILFNLELSF